MTLAALSASLGSPSDDPRWPALARWAAGLAPPPLPALRGLAPDPHALGALHAATRRGDGLGAIYTPPEVARALVGRLLPHVGPAPRVLDPACGGGVFLVEAARALWARQGASSIAERLAVLRAQVRGWDVDPGAVDVARLALAAAAGDPDADLDRVVGVRDALEGPARARFDVVTGNPPWIEAARQVGHDPGRRAALARRFDAARGNWDLFVVFVERALTLLAPGGVHGFVVPDKLASAPYAAGARRLLHGAGRSVTAVADLGDAAFDAAVRPLAYVSVPGHADPARVDWGGHLAAVALPRDGAPWPLPADPGVAALLERLADGPTLADLARVRGAATVSEAYDLRDHLTEDAPGVDGLPAVNSGTLDPLCTLWGRRPLRYLGRALTRPVVRPEHLPPVRRDQARQPKVILAGMTRRLEPLHDLRGGVAALKSTTLVLPHRADDVAWLAAWLASDAASRVYRARFGGLGFRGGYLRVGPPQVADLPIPDLAPGLRADLARVVAGVRGPDDAPAAVAAVDRLLADRVGRRPPAAG